MRKIVILFGIMICIAIGYWIYSVFNSDATTSINIVLLNIDKNENFDSEIEKIREIINLDIDEVKLNIISIKKEQFIIKQPIGIVKANAFEVLINDTIPKIFDKYKDFVLEVNQVDNLFESVITTLLNENNENTKTIFIGSFPDCYDKKDSKETIKLISKLLKGKTLKSKMIFALRTMSEEAENSIIELFEKNKLVEKNANIIVAKRQCGYQQFTTAVMQSVSQNKINDLNNKLKQTIGDNFELLLFSDDSFNNTKVTNDDKKNEVTEIIPKIASTKWESLKNIFDLLCSEMANQKGVSQKQLILIGQIPEAGKGNQKIDWNCFKSCKVFWFQDSNLKINQTTNNFYEGLKIANVDVNVIKF